MEVNKEAEDSFLGCLLKEGELVAEATLQPKHFFHPENKVLYEALVELIKKNEPIDIVAIITHLGQAKVNQIGGKKRLSDLLNSVPSTAQFKAYERYIFEAYKIKTANEIKKSQLTNSTSISQLIQDLSELEREFEEDDEFDLQETQIKLREKHERMIEGMTGLKTGLRDYDNMTDGFQGQDLIVSAARPSVGKTAKMLMHAKSACSDGGLVPIFSLEMSEDQLLERMYADIGRIDLFKLRNPMGMFDEQDWNNYTHAEGEVNKMNLQIYDKPGQKVSEIYSKCRKLRKKYPDKPMWIGIDYLQLIRPDRKGENKNLEVGEITRTLKEMARELNATVYLLSQLSRGLEGRQDKRPVMSDLRDSGSIEQDADIIEFLHRDDYYDQESEKQNIIEIILAKHRNGSVGTIEAAFIKEYNTFLDLDHRYEN